MLTGVTSRLTRAEQEVEPRSLALVAWYDGYSRVMGWSPRVTYPRRLTVAEAREWYDGWHTGHRELAEWRAHQQAIA